MVYVDRVVREEIHLQTPSLWFRWSWRRTAPRCRSRWSPCRRSPASPGPSTATWSVLLVPWARGGGHRGSQPLDQISKNKYESRNFLKARISTKNSEKHEMPLDPLVRKGTKKNIPAVGHGHRHGPLCKTVRHNGRLSLIPKMIPLPPHTHAYINSVSRCRSVVMTV